MRELLHARHTQQLDNPSLPEYHVRLDTRWHQFHTFTILKLECRVGFFNKRLRLIQVDEKHSHR